MSWSVFFSFFSLPHLLYKQVFQLSEQVMTMIKSPGLTERQCTMFISRRQLAEKLTQDDHRSHIYDIVYYTVMYIIILYTHTMCVLLQDSFELHSQHRQWL